MTRFGAAACIACLLPVLAGQATAASCTSPHLAPGFCDRNGNMVADPPDKAQWLDPDPVVIADVPTTDMSKRAEQLAPFLRYLEHAIGRKVNFYAAMDYPDLL